MAGAVLGTESQVHTALGKNLGRKGTFPLAHVRLNTHMHAHSHTHGHNTHTPTLSHVLTHTCSHTTQVHRPTCASSAPSPEHMRQENLVKARFWARFASTWGLVGSRAAREPGIPMGTQWCPLDAPRKGLFLQTWWGWLVYTGPNQAAQVCPLGGSVRCSGLGPTPESRCLWV